MCRKLAFKDIYVNTIYPESYYKINLLVILPPKIYSALE